MPHAREISVTWNKPNHRSQELFNVPLNRIVTLKMIIQARTSETFYVIVEPPSVKWLTLSKAAGRVPFNITVIVDTTHLQEGQGYKEILEFRSMGELIYTEPVYVTTQVYDAQQLAIQPYAPPLIAGKPHRNPLLSILNGIAIVYHLAMTVVYLWVGLFIVLLILAILLSAFNT